MRAPLIVLLLLLVATLSDARVRNEPLQPLPGNTPEKSGVPHHVNGSAENTPQPKAETPPPTQPQTPPAPPKNTSVPATLKMTPKYTVRASTPDDQGEETVLQPTSGGDAAKGETALTPGSPAHTTCGEGACQEQTGTSGASMTSSVPVISDKTEAEVRFAEYGGDVPPKNDSIPANLNLKPKNVVVAAVDEPSEDQCTSPDGCATATEVTPEVKFVNGKTTEIRTDEVHSTGQGDGSVGETFMRSLAELEEEYGGSVPANLKLIPKYTVTPQSADVVYDNGPVDTPAVVSTSDAETPQDDSDVVQETVMRPRTQDGSATIMTGN